MNTDGDSNDDMIQSYSEESETEHPLTSQVPLRLTPAQLHLCIIRGIQAFGRDAEMFGFLMIDRGVRMRNAGARGSGIRKTVEIGPELGTGRDMGTGSGIVMVA